jgi:hypothetical protein
MFIGASDLRPALILAERRSLGPLILRFENQPPKPFLFQGELGWFIVDAVGLPRGRTTTHDSFEFHAETYVFFGHPIELLPCGDIPLRTMRPCRMRLTYDCVITRDIRAYFNRYAGQSMTANADDRCRQSVLLALKRTSIKVDQIRMSIFDRRFAAMDRDLASPTLEAIQIGPPLYRRIRGDVSVDRAGWGPRASVALRSSTGPLAQADQFIPG